MQKSYVLTSIICLQTQLMSVCLNKNITKWFIDHIFISHQNVLLLYPFFKRVFY